MPMRKRDHTETAGQIQEAREENQETARELNETADVVLEVYDDEFSEVLTAEDAATLMQGLDHACAILREEMETDVKATTCQLEAATAEINEEQDIIEGTLEYKQHDIERAIDRNGTPTEPLTRTATELESSEEFHRKLRETNEELQAETQSVVHDEDQKLRSKGI